jgi:hypothetical protein
MFQQLVPVNKARHAATRIKQIEGFGFASQFHIASVMVHEFARASAIYPVVFLEDKAADEFRPVALMGLEQGENLFVDAQGKWAASYVPAIIRRYPFALASTGQEGQFTVCIDEGSALVNQTEGVALFDESGEASAAIENVKRYLGELQQMDAFTRAFSKYFAEHNLFTPLNMRVRQGEQARNITGCYVVNEERLNNLSNERFLEMREKRYLPAVYAHLVSLAQIERLMQLKEERGAKDKPALN